MGPGIVDRFDHVAGPQGDVALDVLDLDGLRGQAADAVDILRAFQIEPLRVAQVDPGEHAPPDLGPVAAHRRHRFPSRVGDQRLVVVIGAHVTDDLASTTFQQLQHATLSDRERQPAS